MKSYHHNSLSQKNRQHGFIHTHIYRIFRSIQHVTIDLGTFAIEYFNLDKNVEIEMLNINQCNMA